ncbi:hypothetical protein ACWHLZ_06625 [Streptomyces chartreusis]|uniref:hypothetical protein n=1 Tax=Streptomyces chartreusis TaxID=1969 RepID=UPI002E7FFC4A|nr:hypothetical protein [Streptomyces chartreusis]WUB16237.1 hypothetical protein OG997_05810 [Streptomyces chartreusis]
MTKRDEEFPFPYERSCARLFSELQGVDDFRVAKAEFGKLSKLMQDPSPVFDSLADRHGLPLSDKVREHYFRYKEIAVSWRPLDEDSEMVGEFRLSHLLSAVTQGHMDDVWDGDDDEERALYGELRVFDDTPRTGTGRMAALRATPGAADPEIWFHDLRDGALQMDLDYPGYLEALLITKGVIGWQYLYCAPEDCGMGFIPLVDGLKEMLDVFPRLFPDHDYTDLRARLEARL